MDPSQTEELVTVIIIDYARFKAT